MSEERVYLELQEDGRWVQVDDRSQLEKLAGILARLQALAPGASLPSDKEAVHGHANDLLVEACETLARGKRQREVVKQIIAAWKNVLKWHA